jgi:hypothetical protein
VEEVILTKAAVVLFCAVLFASAQKNQPRPRIVAPQLCGVLTDLSGVPITKAKVAAMVADVGSSVSTDESGRWGFAGDAGTRWIMIDVHGFEPLIFDYSTNSKKKKNIGDEPAFVRGAGANDLCRTPIHVRLAIAGSKKGVVTLDPRNGLQTESDSH